MNPPRLSAEEIRHLMPGHSTELNPESIRDISPEVLDPGTGRMRVLPASYWASTTVDERALFGHSHGIYLFPTVELVERLKLIIAGRRAIEIGAGNGVLAEALDIPATDSFQQVKEPWKSIYEAIRHPLAPYGPNVIDMHASRAVRHYKPDVVIGAWVTHKYDPQRHELGGNMVGVDQPDILRNCQLLVLVGNEVTHELNPLWERQHEIEYPDYVWSRAHNGSREFIASWRGLKR